MKPHYNCYSSLPEIRSSSSPGCRWDDDDDEGPVLACWKSTSESANPQGDEKINLILQGLLSPAPQSFYIIQRAFHRIQSNDDNHHLLPPSILESCSYLLKQGYHFRVAAKNISNNKACLYQPGVDWTIVPDSAPPMEGWEERYPQILVSSCFQIATKILNLVVMESERQDPISIHLIESMLDEMEQRLDLTLGTDVRGRTCADTVFKLALAGTTRTDIFQKLVRVASLEMERAQNRSSRKPRDILHVIERIAASGVVGVQAKSLYDVALKSLAVLGDEFQVLDELEKKDFSIFHPRALLWLWRFSTRQTKAKEIPAISSNLSVQRNKAHYYDYSWLDRLENPAKPLVVDLGCGFGTCLLGLASCRAGSKGGNRTALPGVDWTECNFVGCDISQLATRFAKGISTRWGLNGKLQYAYTSGDCLLDYIETRYPGKVAMILIQFPSPYRLGDDGNMQLPSESGFMVDDAILQKISRMLALSGGSLIVQSNCEDVAVAVRNMGLPWGLETLAAQYPVLEPDQLGHPTQRTLRWMERGGERAVGAEWSSVPLLPVGCVTETEVSCFMNKIPVHRCQMRAKSGFPETT